MTSLAPKPRIRLTKEVRRSQILNAAKELFLTLGVEGTSMRVLAAKIGVTPAAIYQHFADKNAILLAIGEEFFAGLIERQNELALSGPRSAARFRAMMAGYIDYGLAHTVEYRLVFMTPILDLRVGHRIPKELQDVMISTKGNESFDLFRADIAELFAQGVYRGHDPEVAAEAVWAALHGLVALLITHRRDAFIDIPAMTRTLIGILDDGLARGTLTR